MPIGTKSCSGTGPLSIAPCLNPMESSDANPFQAKPRLFGQLIEKAFAILVINDRLTQGDSFRITFRRLSMITREG